MKQIGWFFTVLASLLVIVFGTNFLMRKHFERKLWLINKTTTTGYNKPIP